MPLAVIAVTFMRDMMAAKRGPGTKSYWLTVWAMKASSKGVPMAEIKSTMAAMKKKSIAEIREFLKASSAKG